jgi:hypothetical protein
MLLGSNHTLEQIRPEERRLVIELREGQSVLPVLERLGEGVTHFELRDDAGRRVVTAELPKSDDEPVATLAELDAVAGVRWRR